MNTTLMNMIIALSGGAATYLLLLVASRLNGHQK
jgi:hypothetical protein